MSIWSTFAWFNVPYRESDNGRDEPRRDEEGEVTQTFVMLSTTAQHDLIRLTVDHVPDGCHLDSGGGEVLLTLDELIRLRDLCTELIGRTEL